MIIQDYLLKNSFISCWHKNFDENMVMWKSMGRDNNAIAIQTTVKNIKEVLDLLCLTGHSLKLKVLIYEQANEFRGVLAI